MYRTLLVRGWDEWKEDGQAPCKYYPANGVYVLIRARVDRTGQLQIERAAQAPFFVSARSRRQLLLSKTVQTTLWCVAATVLVAVAVMIVITVIGSSR